jgi:hypothetical protein
VPCRLSARFARLIGQLTLRTVSPLPLGEVGLSGPGEGLRMTANPPIGLDHELTHSGVRRTFLSVASRFHSTTSATDKNVRRTGVGQTVIKAPTL